MGGIGIVFLTIAVVNSYRIIKYIVILIRKREEEKKKENIKNLLLSIIAVIISTILMWGTHSLLERLQQPPLSWVKTSFTEDEINLICGELRLTPTERYQITSARYELGEELSVYLHIDDEVAGTLEKAYGDMRFYSQDKLEEYVSRTDGVVGFFKEVCGYPEEYLKKELRRLGNLNAKEGGVRTYINMFGEEQICIIVYPYDEEENGLYTYVWKEEEGYGIEVLRNHGIFCTVTEQELYEIFYEKESENE